MTEVISLTHLIKIIMKNKNQQNLVQERPWASADYEQSHKYYLQDGSVINMNYSIKIHIIFTQTNTNIINNA